MERLYTTEEVAEWLRIDVATVRRLVARGEVTAYRVGNEYRFKSTDVEAYLLHQRVTVSDGADANSRRLTQRAAIAFQWAHDQGRKSGARHVDAMYVLLSLTNSEDCVAGQVLQRLGVTMARVRDGATTSVITGGTSADSLSDKDASSNGISDVSNDSLELGMEVTSELSQIIRLAIDETIRIGRHRVGTGQILLGMLRSDETVPAQVLRAMGVTYDSARAHINQVIQMGQAADD